jgi:hypothetical protein
LAIYYQKGISMPIATTTEAARAVASNVQANRAQQAREARQQAAAELEQQRARRVDTTTPLGTGAMMPVEELPASLRMVEEQAAAPAVEARPAMTLRTQISYRGRSIWIEAKGMTLDSFCDMLDKRLGKAD